MKELKATMRVYSCVYKHPDTPKKAKIILAILIGYFFSPIDLIPDFIPILGYLDDIIILPLGLSLARKMVSVEIIEECKQKVIEKESSAKSNWIAGGIILLIWIAIIVYILHKIKLI